MTGRPRRPLIRPPIPGVIAVTGVDGRGRVLAEAGRASHLDYAAPGADMAAASPDGGIAPVRGTSFAVPFVAGRLALHVRARRSRSRRSTPKRPSVAGAGSAAASSAAPAARLAPPR